MIRKWIETLIIRLKFRTMRKREAEEWEAKLQAEKRAMMAELIQRSGRNVGRYGK